MALKNFEVIQKSSVYGGEEFYDHPKNFELGDLYFDVEENRLYWVEGKNKIRSSATNGNDVVLHVSLKLSDRPFETKHLVFIIDFRQGMMFKTQHFHL